MSIRVVRFVVIAAALSVGLLQIDTAAQDRLKSMPGFAQYQKIAPQIAGAVKSGAVMPAWNADGRSFEYSFDGKRYRYDVAARQATAIGESGDAAGRGGRGGRGQGAPERGRQFASSDSPDGKLRAHYSEKDRNLYLVDVAAKTETPITTDGSDEKPHQDTAPRAGSTARSSIRAPRCGGRPTARRSPSTASTRARCPTTTCSSTRPSCRARSTSSRTPRPARRTRSSICSSTTSPRKKTAKVDVRDGKPFANDVVGHYVYHVSWSPDGKELLFNRTNRRQNIMEFVAADPASGQVPRRRPRGVAGELGREHARDAVPEGQQAVHLGVRADRLEELLPLRPDAASCSRR